jgi:hypothetical protein
MPKIKPPKAFGPGAAIRSELYQARRALCRSNIVDHLVAVLHSTKRADAISGMPLPQPARTAE